MKKYVTPQEKQARKERVLAHNFSESAASSGYVANVHDEFDRLLEKLHGVETWTASERAAFFCFFCHGWYGRVNEAAYQAT